MQQKKNLLKKNRLHTNAKSRLIHNFSSRSYKTLKDNVKSSPTKDLLGFNVELGGKCIEYQMSPEMNWNNIDIDHVKPIALFDLSKEKRMREAINWKNTQPLLNKAIFEKVEKYFNRLSLRVH